MDRRENEGDDAMMVRKKPVLVEAEQYTGDTGKLSYHMGTAISKSLRGGPCWISTLAGELRCDVGDWIIKGVKGEFYPIKNSIFQLTYDRE